MQVAVCNLASISLVRFVTSDRQFNFKQLEYVTAVIVKNLNKIIDVNYYPVPEVCSTFILYLYISVQWLRAVGSVIKGHLAGSYRTVNESSMLMDLYCAIIGQLT